MRYSNDDILDALRENGGTVSGAARQLGCSATTIRKRARQVPEIAGAIRKDRAGGRGKARTKQWSDEEIIGAIRAEHGNISAAARQLGCDRSTITGRAEESEEIRRVIDEETETLLDEGEAKLAEAVRSGEKWAILYLLSTKGKRRGYTKEQIVDLHQHIVVDLPDSFAWPSHERSSRS